MNMGQRRETNRGMGLTALELVEAFVEETGTDDPEEAEITRDAVMLAGEYIAEVVGPARWELFDGGGFFKRVAFMSPRDQEGLGLALMGFYGWMIFSGRLDPGDGLEVMGTIRSQFPDSKIIEGLYRTTEPMLLEAISQVN